MNVVAPCSPMRESRTIVPGNSPGHRMKKAASIKNLISSVEPVVSDGESDKHNNKSKSSNSSKKTKQEKEKRSEMMTKQKSERVKKSKKSSSSSSSTKKKRSMSMENAPVKTQDDEAVVKKSSKKSTSSSSSARRKRAMSMGEVPTAKPNEEIDTKSNHSSRSTKSKASTTASSSPSSSSRLQQQETPQERVLRLEAELQAMKQKLLQSTETAPPNPRQRSLRNLFRRSKDQEEGGEGGEKTGPNRSWRNLFSSSRHGDEGSNSTNNSTNNGNSSDKKPKRGFFRKFFGGSSTKDDCETVSTEQSAPAAMRKSKSMSNLNAGSSSHNQKETKERVQQKEPANKLVAEVNSHRNKALKDKTTEPKSSKSSKKKYARRRGSLQLGSTPSGEIEPPNFSPPVRVQDHEEEETEFSIADNTEHKIHQAPTTPSSQSQVKKKKKKKKRKTSSSSATNAGNPTAKSTTSSGHDTETSHSAPSTTRGEDSNTGSTTNKKKSRSKSRQLEDQHVEANDNVHEPRPFLASTVSDESPNSLLGTDPYVMEDLSHTCEDFSESCFSLSGDSPHVWCQPSDQAAFVELDIRRLDGEIEKRLTFDS